jgi:hypothetical protein
MSAGSPQQDDLVTLAQLTATPGRSMPAAHLSPSNLRAGRSEADRSLCLVRAGNTDDVDLGWSAQRPLVDLVDWDGEAMAGRSPAGLLPRSTFDSTAGGATGIASAAWVGCGGSATMPSRIVRRALCADVVSAPRLCHHILVCCPSLSAWQPGRGGTAGLFDLIDALRRRHCRLLIDDLRIGGTMFLVWFCSRHVPGE